MKFYQRRKLLLNTFYLLDKDDKIKVLKQIEEYIKSNKKKTSSISLDLLEDDDLKSMNYRYIKL